MKHSFQHLNATRTPIDLNAAPACPALPFAEVKPVLPDPTHSVGEASVSTACVIPPSRPKRPASPRRTNTAPREIVVEITFQNVCAQKQHVKRHHRQHQPRRFVNACTGTSAVRSSTSRVRCANACTSTSHQKWHRLLRGVLAWFTAFGTGGASVAKQW